MEPNTKDSINIDDFMSAQHKSQKGKKNFELWKKQILYKWLEDHKKKPYPTEKQKMGLAMKLGMSKKQVSNWFVNTRKVCSCFRSL